MVQGQRIPLRLHNNTADLLAAKSQRDGVAYQQKDISIATGLSETTVSRLLNDDITRIAFGYVVVMAQWLGVPVDAMAVSR